jgi:cysteine desulfurase
MAQFLGCHPSEIVFTSGGTESDNLAVFGSVKPGDHVITTMVEHHAVLHAGEKLRDRGVEVDFLPVDGQGVIAPEGVRQALRPNTRLISVMMANNETGVLQPVQEIGLPQRRGSDSTWTRCRPPASCRWRWMQSAAIC